MNKTDTAENEAQMNTDTQTQFGTSEDGRPTLILGDQRSTDEKLRCAQAQIESDRQTITGLQSHDDKLAETLRGVIWKCDAHGSWKPTQAEREVMHAALAAYESEVQQ